MPYICDLNSVGAIIRRQNQNTEEFLLITRSDGKGHAPVAGHVYDIHPETTPEQAVEVEVWEEAGLTLTSARLLTQGWRPNRCSGRIPDDQRPGHYWRIYDVDTQGTLSPCPDETQGALWAPREHLQALAERAAAYARGEVTSSQWRESPGLEAVWCDWLGVLGLVDLPAIDQERLAALAATPPNHETTTLAHT